MNNLNKKNNKRISLYNPIVNVDNITRFQHILWILIIVFASFVASNFLFKIDISFLAIPQLFLASKFMNFLMITAIIVISFSFFYLRIHTYRLSTTHYYISFLTLLIYFNLRYLHKTPIHWEFIFLNDKLAILDIIFLLFLFLFLNSFRKEFIKLQFTPNSIFLEDIPQQEITKSDQYDNLLSNIESVLFDDYFEKAFTIGVIGSWGSGKSSLLNSISAKIRKSPDFNKKIILIPFSPFLNYSEEKIIQEFFNQLSNELNKKSGKLSNKLLDYSAKLSNVIKDGNPLTFLKKGIYSNENESVKDLYSGIVEVLETLNIKIIVTIDDLDRLSANEILQVLKLIRNTANFPNTVFFVALDKEYVSSTLKKENENLTENYLDKFFQLELHVSKVPTSAVIDFALSKIITSLSELGLNKMNQKKINDIFKKNIQELFNFLVHYRDAKRFTNQFILDFRLLHARNINSEEIDFEDFTFLTLLKTFTTTEYRMIENRNEKLIQRSESIHEIWILSEMTVRTSVKKVDQILSKLFPTNMNFNTFISSNLKRNSIAFDKSLRLYFERILSIEELSEDEFKEIYNSDDLESVKLRLLNLSRTNNKITHFIEMLIKQKTEYPTQLQFKVTTLMHAINLLDDFNNQYFSEFARQFKLIYESGSNSYTTIKNIALSSKNYSPIFQAKFLNLMLEYEPAIKGDGSNLIEHISNQILTRFSNDEREQSFKLVFKEFKMVFEELFKIPKIKNEIRQYTIKNILKTNEEIFLQQSIILDSNNFQWCFDPIIFKIIGSFSEIEAYAKSAFQSNSNKILEYLDFLELWAIQNGNQPLTYQFKHFEPIDIFGGIYSSVHHVGFGQIVFECISGFKNLVEKSLTYHSIYQMNKVKNYNFGNLEYWFIEFTENDQNGLVSIAKQFQSLANDLRNENLEYNIIGEGTIVRDKKTEQVIISIRSIQPYTNLRRLPISLERI